MLGFWQPKSLLEKWPVKDYVVLVHLHQTLSASLQHGGLTTFFLPFGPTEEEGNQLTVDLEGSVSLVGPPFLCCNRNQTDYNPFSPLHTPSSLTSHRAGFISGQ